MSIDRCIYVKNIIAAQFNRAHEGITGEEEADDIFTVKAVAPTMERADELIELAAQALAADGYRVVELKVEPRADNSASLIIRVDVGGIRGEL